MDNLLRQTKDIGDCRVFDYMKMCYILLNCLFKMDTSQSTDISLGNKFLDRRMGRKEILRLIDYYIELNNIVYVDNVKEEERQNDG